MKRLDLGPRLDAARYLASLEADGERLAAVSERRLNASVPGCPGWTAADLVWHVAGVHHFWRTIAAGDASEPSDVARQQRPAPEGLLDLYRSNLAGLVETLRDADPDRNAWSWSPEKNVAWIRRRMAHETAVHRWDAESAVGAQAPIATDIAVDGIDEYLEFFIEEKTLARASDATVHLHATDTEGEWFVQIRKGDLEARRSHEKGNVAVRGAASDLLLLLWGRLPEANVEVHGDRAALFAFLQLADLS